MVPATLRGFLQTLAASAGGAALSGAAAALVVSLNPPGPEAGAHPALWVLVGLPVAAALAFAGALARTPREVLANSAAFLLPQAGVAITVFFLFAHPGGGGGGLGVLATPEFWLKLGGAYLLTLAFVGAASLAFRFARR